VRELENAVENAIVLGEGEVILPKFLPLTIYSEQKMEFHKRIFSERKDESFRWKLDFAERLILKDAIEKAGNNKSAAAKNLKISLRTMRYKIKKYNL
jgi:transcriptional regulator with PAS, ATPase and Fis domain